MSSMARASNISAMRAEAIGAAALVPEWLSVQPVPPDLVQSVVTWNKK